MAIPFVSSPLVPIRRHVAAAVRGALGVDGDLDAIYGLPLGDAGLFGPQSMAWLVHGDLPAMLIGGLSALMHQTLHPLAMAGVAAHSSYRQDPLGRLRRTAHFVAGTTFGSTALAEELIAKVQSVHLRVVGIARDGRPYAASDPELLTFVHATEVDGFLRSYQRYAPRPLLMGEKDRYVEEMSEIARRLGAAHVPTSLGQLRSYLTRVRSELSATPESFEAVMFLAHPESSARREAFVQAIVARAAIDLLPRFAREELGLRSTPIASPAAVRLAAHALGTSLRWALGRSEVRAVALARVSHTHGALR